MAIVCDGMGGLSKGELASATIIRSFDYWFEYVLPGMLTKAFSHGERPDMTIFSDDWVRRLRNESNHLKEYSFHSGAPMGTTFSGVLFVDNDYLIVHVGDSRVYLVDHQIQQMTKDQTVVEREIDAGRLTQEEAKHHPKRNTLLQCVGASKKLNPEIKFGRIDCDCVFLLCSDGFRHHLSNDELLELFCPCALDDRNKMDVLCRQAIQTVISRGEKDNISVAIIKIMLSEVSDYA
jgi:serine/threonine protein phosphatase PrpC